MRIRRKNKIIEVTSIEVDNHVIKFSEDGELKEYEFRGCADDDVIDHMMKHGFIDISELDMVDHEPPIPFFVRVKDENGDLPFV